NTVTNYEINEKIEKHKYAPGDVEQLSVSVILNNEENEETVNNIRNAVQAAIGYQEDRNDQVSVTSMQFNDSLEEEATQAQLAAQAENRRRMYIYGGLIAFILLALIATFFILRKGTEEETYETGQTVDMMVGEEATSSSEEELSEEEKERRKMKEDIEELVNDRPGEIAQLLKSWLEQD
ncbi:MAG TPA: flagellar M-ring protein FliF C-terminal domain-containing protein, partial [Halanaerobiales bacterium]|nr:flagellar M-ring protein FliF C-terminal domain-containing protein [Halanaerobiales bacterium]